MKNIGITVFGCDRQEANLFYEFAPRYNVIPAIINKPVSACTLPDNISKCISVDHKTKVSATNLTALKQSGVRYISTRSVGVDHIDIEAAIGMGIEVGNSAYAPDGVADYTVMLMLMAIRNIKSVVTGTANLDFRLNAYRGKELRDMTVGVIGTGRIGTAVMDRLRGFGCKIITCDKSETINSLLEQSDVITLHAPLNSDTYHIISRERIGIMKQGAYLINTGRGALVDTGEIIKALESGKLGGAALDVLEGEEGYFYFDCSQKPIENEFLLGLQKMPNVILTPHTAYYTERVLADTVHKTIQGCLNFERKSDNG